MLHKIISGGQTGVDQAGLRAAVYLGLQTGGMMPRTWRTEAGPRPEFKDQYGMVQSMDYSYAPRTRYNVKSADATVILGHPGSPGCKLTALYCTRLKKPYITIYRSADTLDSARYRMREFLKKHKKVEVLNVAGNREESYPGIGVWAECVLLFALDEVVSEHTL